MAGRSVRRVIPDLGYRVHTPTEVFGKERLDRCLTDDEWLPVVGAEGWAVFGRDRQILSRELELRAYLDARPYVSPARHGHDGQDLGADRRQSG
jgi:PIN like domain